MASSSEGALIKTCLHQFVKKVRNLVPLRHLSEFKDEATIRDVAQQEADKGCVYFMKQLKKSKISLDKRGDLLNEFCSQIEGMVDRYVKVNQEYKTEWESFLQKRIDSISEDLRLSLDAKLLMNPDMDLHTAEGLIESEKVSAISYFEQMWKHGNLGTYEKQKGRLELKLNELKNEMVERQSHRLKMKAEEDARKAKEEVKKIVLDFSSQLKSQVADANGEDPKQIVLDGVLDIIEYLEHDGSFLNDNYGKLYSQMLVFLKGVVKYLEEVGEGNLSLEDAASLAKQVDSELKSCFLDHEKETRKMHHHHHNNNVENTNNDHDDHDHHKPDSSGDAKVEESVEDEPQVMDSIHRVTGPGRIMEESESDRDDSDSSSTPSEIMYEHPQDKRHPQAHQSKNQNGRKAVVTAPASKTSKPSVPGNTAPMAFNKRHNSKAPTGKVPPSAPASSSKPQKASPPQSSGKAEVSSDLINVPGKGGYVPLLRALLTGQSVAIIQKLLDAGANVNAKTKDGFNAAHLVIMSLMEGKLKSSDAVPILNLLVSKGFKFINSKTATGYTPLFLALEFPELDETLLSWFYKNGADFNAVDDEFGNSILLDAIIRGHEEGLISKLLEFGAKPEIVNEAGDSALHVAAYSAHDTALEILIDIDIDQLDVNGVNQDNSTPLSMLFMQAHLNYLRCLEILLKNGGDLSGSCEEKCPNAVVHWMKHGKENPFPALLKTKNKLPLTEEIASATLTTIVEDIQQLQRFLHSSTPHEHQHPFVQFTLFLIHEKNAKLNLECEGKWKLRKVKELERILIVPDFTKKLKSIDKTKWKGSLLRIKSATVANFEFQTDQGGRTISVPTEAVLGCLLACGAYKGFVNVCACLLSAVHDWSSGDRSKCVVQ